MHSSLLSLTSHRTSSSFYSPQTPCGDICSFGGGSRPRLPRSLSFRRRPTRRKRRRSVVAFQFSNNEQQQRRQEEEEEEEQTTKSKREGFRFIQSFIEADKDDDKKKYYQVSYPNLAISAALVTVFSSVFTASVVHWKNRKHKLERDLSIGVHAKASIKGLKALAVATGFSLSLVSVLFASTNYIGLWEKEQVGRRIAAPGGAPGGGV